ncbi:hypothetical protein HAX54_021017, partial [Datura stramonium]|nr:hypothetical protein [Datura stramonium]
FHLGINSPLKHPKMEHNQLPTLVEGIVTYDMLVAVIMNYGDNGSPELVTLHLTFSFLFFFSGGHPVFSSRDKLSTQTPKDGTQSPQPSGRNCDL